MFFIPASLVSALTFPGVVVHELAHQLFCRFFNIPVYKVCYFRFGNPAGYVIHGESTNWTHHVLVSIGPFFVNSLFGALLTFPSALRVFEFNGAATFVDGILMWLGISIATHSIPSIGDAKSMWAAASGKGAPLLAKLCVSPVVGLLFILSFGSVVWLDLLYGIAVSLALPKLMVAMLT